MGALLILAILTVVTVTFGQSDDCSAVTSCIGQELKETIAQKAQMTDFPAMCLDYKSGLDCINAASTATCRASTAAATARLKNITHNFCGPDGKLLGCGSDAYHCIRILNDYKNNNATDPCTVVERFSNCVQVINSNHECPQDITQTLINTDVMFREDSALTNCYGPCGAAIANCTYDLSVDKTNLTNHNGTEFCINSYKATDCMHKLFVTPVCSQYSDSLVIRAMISSQVTYQRDFCAVMSVTNGHTDDCSAVTSCIGQELRETIAQKAQMTDFPAVCLNYKSGLDCINAASTATCRASTAAATATLNNITHNFCGPDGKLLGCGSDAYHCIRILNDYKNNNGTDPCTVVERFSNCVQVINLNHECPQDITRTLINADVMFREDSALTKCYGPCGAAIANCTYDLSVDKTNLTNHNRTEFCIDSYKATDCMHKLFVSPVCSQYSDSLVIQAMISSQATYQRDFCAVMSVTNGHTDDCSAVTACIGLELMETIAEKAQMTDFPAVCLNYKSGLDCINAASTATCRASTAAATATLKNITHNFCGPDGKLLGCGSDAYHCIKILNDYKNNNATDSCNVVERFSNCVQVINSNHECPQDIIQTLINADVMFREDSALTDCYGPCGAAIANCTYGLSVDKSGLTNYNWTEFCINSYKATDCMHKLFVTPVCSQYSDSLVIQAMISSQVTYQRDFCESTMPLVLGGFPLCKK